MRLPRAATFVVLASVALLTRLGVAQQVRDGAVPYIPTGSGLISGTVVTDETPAKPVRRATVTLAESSNGIVNRIATTNDEGRYAFGGLPPGKYTITASRPPYLRGSYGAHRMISPSSVVVPTTVPIAAGQQVTGLTIYMRPGAVISGMVRDEGQPVMGAQINVWYAQLVSGLRTLVSAGAYTSTDDRGIYRVYGLAPGDIHRRRDTARLAAGGSGDRKRRGNPPRDGVDSTAGDAGRRALDR